MGGFVLLVVVVGLLVLRRMRRRRLDRASLRGSAADVALSLLQPDAARHDRLRRRSRRWGGF